MNSIKNIDRERLDALIHTSFLINSDYADLPVVLEGIVSSAMTVVGGEAASLLVLEDNKENLRFEIAIGPKGVEAKKIVLGLNGIGGWVVKNNKSLITNDVANDKRYDFTVQNATGYKTRNMLAVPMRIKGVCIGVIEVLNKIDNKDFDADDLAVLEVFASHVAVSYQISTNYRKSREEIISLQDQIKQDKGYHTMVAESPIMIEKLELCKKMAASDASVLILGESGVGKELVAEHIHLNSERSEKPFIRVNCAALPGSLLESELFGHVRGAFTDAVSDRIGRFETADTGTIFLDEIGEIPMSLQAKLLRVIQDKSFERVGSSNTIHVDVRIVAATNRDLNKLIQENKFRSDLYYRLNVLPVYIPPLNQRIEDIPALANFFLKRFGKEVKKDFLGFSDSAMGRMISYSWPGNIRELENAVERACVIGKPPYITDKDLFLKIDDVEITEGSNKTLKTAVDSFKKIYISDILKKYNWNRTAAAAVLDIQRTYLSRLIKELDLKEY